MNASFYFPAQKLAQTGGQVAQTPVSRQFAVFQTAIKTGAKTGGPKTGGENWRKTGAVHGRKELQCLRL
jgi:hypothetical protein